MASCLDHTQDTTGTEQHRLTQLFDAPDFVKNASHEQLYGDTAALPGHVFGDVRNRVYPCHTKSATWMSALFFGDNHQHLPGYTADAVRDRLIKSAEFFGIKTEVEALWTKMAVAAQDTYNDLPDDTFALVWDTGNGVKERHYPLRNANEVKTAAAWFNQHHKSFRFTDKHTVATKILEKAAAFEAVLDDVELLDRCAGFGHCPTTTAVNAWAKRASFTKASKPEHAKHAQAIADELDNHIMDGNSRYMRTKMAHWMDEFDRETGIDKLYGQHDLQSPEDTLFGLTEKTASDFVNNHVQTTNGTVYEKSALSSLDIDHVRQWLGDEFADEVGGAMLDTEKLATLVPTLPRPEAVMFERMATAANVPVFARQKSAADQSIPPGEMEALAAIYRQEKVAAAKV